MAYVPLRLERDAAVGVHDDLLLKLGTYRHTCDSYYLAIDDSPAAGGTIAQGLARLLDQWVSLLNRLGPGATVFLPYDFSDQCTAWLRVQDAGGGRVVVRAGWSAIPGYRILPSDITTASPPDDFDPLPNAGIECDLADLVDAVERNRDAFAGDPPAD